MSEFVDPFESKELTEALRERLAPDAPPADEAKVEEPLPPADDDEVPPDPDPAPPSLPSEPEFDPSVAPRGGLVTGPYYVGEIPDDIAQVWVIGKLPMDEQTVRTLIGSWGMDVFRDSAIHKRAVLDADRQKNMEPIRAAFIKARQKKQKGE